MPSIPIQDNHVKRRFRVTGKVQGVYFRQNTRMEAERLGIGGIARNLSDGSVEVLAHGAPEAIDALHRWLHRGPRHARVDGVEELSTGERPDEGIPGVFCVE